MSPTLSAILAEARLERIEEEMVAYGIKTGEDLEMFEDEELVDEFNISPGELTALRQAARQMNADAGGQEVASGAEVPDVWGGGGGGGAPRVRPSFFSALSGLTTSTTTTTSTAGDGSSTTTTTSSSSSVTPMLDPSVLLHMLSSAGGTAYTGGKNNLSWLRHGGSSKRNKKNGGGGGGGGEDDWGVGDESFEDGEDSEGGDDQFRGSHASKLAKKKKKNKGNDDDDDDDDDGGGTGGGSVLDVPAEWITGKESVGLRIQLDKNEHHVMELANEGWRVVTKEGVVVAAGHLSAEAWMSVIYSHMRGGIVTVSKTEREQEIERESMMAPDELVLHLREKKRKEAEEAEIERKRNESSFLFALGGLIGSSSSSSSKKEKVSSDEDWFAQFEVEVEGEQRRKSEAVYEEENGWKAVEVDGADGEAEVDGVADSSEYTMEFSADDMVAGRASLDEFVEVARKQSKSQERNKSSDRPVENDLPELPTGLSSDGGGGGGQLDPDYLENLTVEADTQAAEKKKGSGGGGRLKALLRGTKWGSKAKKKKKAEEDWTQGAGA